MHKKVTQGLFWLLTTLFIFVVFYWIFSISIPMAALEFSVGITLILVTGLLCGRYMAKIWLVANKKAFNRIIAALIGIALSSLFLIGVFISRMLQNTEFSSFLFTVICLFVLSADIAATITLTRSRAKENIRLAERALSQSKTELQLLQSQLSPHFLFNTLNNLYGLSMSDHKKIPALLLKLSELLRYTVYDAKELFVPLENEINYLENYIAFEKIRLGNRLSLSYSLQSVKGSSMAIAPMLLIVFVENAFKHSKNSDSENVIIDMNLKVVDNAIHFFITNSFKPVPTGIIANKTQSGFGLDSVRKRLDLLYKNRHKLKIIKTNNIFTVNFFLETDDH